MLNRFKSSIFLKSRLLTQNPEKTRETRQTRQTRDIREIRETKGLICRACVCACVLNRQSECFQKSRLLTQNFGQRASIAGKITVEVEANAIGDHFGGGVWKTTLSQLCIDPTSTGVSTYWDPSAHALPKFNNPHAQADLSNTISLQQSENTISA
jgi:hypothetical protein